MFFISSSRSLDIHRKSARLLFGALVLVTAGLSCQMAKAQASMALDDSDLGDSHLGDKTSTAADDVISLPTLASLRGLSLEFGTVPGVETIRPTLPSHLTPAAGEGLDPLGARSLRRLGGAGLYAYVNLAPALPVRLHGLLGKPDGGISFELRPGASNMLTQLSLGSVMRWKAGGKGQVGLRWRGGKLGLNYGRRFDL